jgi:predicted nucleic acid-binding protein
LRSGRVAIRGSALNGSRELGPLLRLAAKDPWLAAGHRFGCAELVSSFHLAVHRKYVDRETAFAGAADLEADLREGRLTLVDALWRKTLDLTADLSARHTPRTGTRTLDVLHVATAIVLETTHFATYDKRQAKLAKEVGLRVITL